MKYSLSPIEFKNVYNNSESLTTKDLLFNYTSDETPKLGFTVSKKYGNSVQRNLFKRRCRYAFYKLIKGGFNYSIIIKPSILGGYNKFFDLCKICKKYNTNIILSSSLESSIGNMATLH